MIQSDHDAKLPQRSPVPPNEAAFFRVRRCLHEDGCNLASQTPGEIAANVLTCC
ncbi:hypothetical protein RRSWK_05755 [Rhodopirellula sp. SWK7]|nr:hypothetical protein RRSWK_05755 [Rhodopirellula sp. SWK7]